jgi:hypothetical protein
MPVYVAQRDAIDLVERCGGTFFLERVEWLAGTVGDDFAAMGDKLTAIDVSGRPFGDAELESLLANPAHLPHLERLAMADTNISDEAARPLGRLPSLRRLDLRGTRVSFSLRRRLARISHIEQVEGTSRWSEFFRRPPR